MSFQGGGYRRGIYEGGGLKLLIDIGVNRNSEVIIDIEKVINEFYQQELTLHGKNMLNFVSNIFTELGTFKIMKENVVFSSFFKRIWPLKG